jgi:hypothetical protein
MDKSLYEVWKRALQARPGGGALLPCHEPSFKQMPVDDGGDLRGEDIAWQVSVVILYIARRTVVHQPGGDRQSSRKMHERLATLPMDAGKIGVAFKEREHGATFGKFGAFLARPLSEASGFFRRLAVDQHRNRRCGQTPDVSSVLEAMVKQLKVRVGAKLQQRTD